MLVTDLADLTQRTDISFNVNILSIPRNVRHHRKVTRVNVPPAGLTKLGLHLTKGRLQVARPAERALERLDADDPGEKRAVSLEKTHHAREEDIRKQSHGKKYKIRHTGKQWARGFK